MTTTQEQVQQARIEKAGRVSVAANNQFLRDNRELLVSFEHKALAESMLAFIRLHMSEQIRNSEPSTEFYLACQESAFLNLYDREAINPVAAITALGQQALDAMRQRTNIGYEAPAPPEPSLTPAQKLEQEVRSDWKTLSATQIRRKVANDRSYRETFERISGDLESTATTFTTIPGA